MDIRFWYSNGVVCVPNIEYDITASILKLEWIPLTGIDVSRIKEEFRDESLTGIIQARKDESRQVENYRTLCEQRGQAPNVLDLGAQPCEEAQQALPPPPLEQQEPLPNLLESSPLCLEACHAEGALAP